MGYKSLIETQEIVVIRPPLQYFEDMEWKTDEFPVLIPKVFVNIQPFKLVQRRWVVPEGYRVEDVVIVYSKVFQLLTSNAVTQTVADRFHYNGYNYEVIQEQNWKDFNLSTDHFVCMAVRKEPARDPLEEFVE